MLSSESSSKRECNDNNSESSCEYQVNSIDSSHVNELEENALPQLVESTQEMVQNAASACTIGDENYDRESTSNAQSEICQLPDQTVNSEEDNDDNNSDDNDDNDDDDDDEFESLEDGSDDYDSSIDTVNDKHVERDSTKGCIHYERNCRIVAPCCNEIFDCRVCHDSVKNNTTTEDAASSTDLHQINRFEIKEVICRKCDHRQLVSNTCVACGVEFGKYFCSICNLWDNDGLTKLVFHCESCGICRVGGRENFFHCPKCDCCYPLTIKDTHKCLEKAMHSGCCICLEDMFSSLTPVLVLECGHTFHQHCLSKLMRSPGISALRCPLCFKSFTDNKELWEKLDEIILQNPLPEPLAPPIVVKCHDCEKLSKTQYHFYGLKCSECGSYNTTRCSDNEGANF